MRFMHVADFHLGYQQYGSKERFNDFSQVFLYIVEQAIEQQVDFVLLAGDLFEKRTVDPLAMRVAIEGFRMLREAGVSVVAVEGNHEKAHYRDQYSWVDFLDGLGYLYLLNPRFEDGRAILEPYGDIGGAYLDLPGGIRVYGLKYTDPNLVYDAVRALLKREGSGIARDPAPVVELTLSGVLPFSRYDLDLDYVKGLLDDAWSPLVTRVRNMTTPAEFEIAVDVEASRPELERTIVRELLERDARFRPAADAWTRVALDVKRLVLEDSTPETVIDYLRRSIAQKPGFFLKTRFLGRGT